jgi:hypothetical protein
MISKDIDSLEAACRRCRRVHPRQDLDRLLWCDACQEAAQARAARQGWYVGLVMGVALALWIWLYIQPSNLVIGGWVGTVLAAFYMSARLTREVLYGVQRVRGEAGGEAVSEAAALEDGLDP